MDPQNESKTYNLSTRQCLDDYSDENETRPPSPKTLDINEEEQKGSSVCDEKHVSDEEITGLDDEEEEDKQYYLVSSDKVEFPLLKDETMMSNLVVTTLNINNDERKVPIPAVNSQTLKHVVNYMKYHAKDPVPQNNTPEKLQSNVFSEEVKCKWDVAFIENDIMGDPETAKSNIYDITRAANYMDIEPLLQLACTKVASMIKGESLDAIKKIISTDYPYKDTHNN